MGFTPEQIKGRIKSVAKQNNADARTLMRIYMMERFLERLAQSEYRDNFIIKGGILVTAMIGVVHRSTMDIDTSMKNLNLSAEDALRVVNQVKDIDLDDGVSFDVKDVSNIMDEMEYPGIRVTMNANVGRLITPLKIDISTGDVITPRAIEFNYDLLLEDRSISLWSYNLETILAEKLQTVLARGINNRNKVVMGSVDFPLKGKVRCGNCRRAMGYDYKQASPIFWCREGQELIGQTKCSSEIFQANDIENAVFQALKKELSLLGSLYGDIKKEEQSLKEASRKASRRKTSMEQELKNLKGEKMRMYEEYAAGTLSLDNYKNKKQEYDRKIAEVQDKIEQSKAEEAAQSVVPGTVRVAAEQAENFLHGTRLTASMVSAFIENVYVH